MKGLVIGAGSWGTALAGVLADNGHEVSIYGQDEKVIQEINSFHTNSAYFEPGIVFNSSIKAVSSLKENIADKDFIVLSVPSKAYKSVLNELAALLLSSRPPLIISTGKGFDPDTFKRLSVLIEEIIPIEKRRGVVSLIGPSFAKEVANKQLTCISAVSSDLHAGQETQKLFSNSYFRVYVNSDVIGAEYASAIKNVIAIASGILTGLGYKDNARAALVTRGLYEMSRFGVKKGGKTETYLGLTGLGDLMMTCTSSSSRNFSAGVAIGQADSAEGFLKENTKTVEGIYTAKVIYEESVAEKIEMPIVKSVYQVLFEKKKPSKIIGQLMTRSLKNEF